MLVIIEGWMVIFLSYAPVIHSWRESHDVKEERMAIAKSRTNEGLIKRWVSWKVISYIFMPQNAVDNNII